MCIIDSRQIVINGRDIVSDTMNTNMNKRYGMIGLTTDIINDHTQISVTSNATTSDRKNLDVIKGNHSECVQENIYENLKELNYDAGSESSVQTAGYSFIRDYYCDENIYENICENCGRIYDDKCDFCYDEPEDALIHNKNFQSKRLLPKLWRNFKFNKSANKFLLRKSSKSRKKSDHKLEIVHHINGTDDVFKTNATFDLQEICQMRSESMREKENQITTG